MSQAKVPAFDTLYNPTLEALKALGGSGTIEEINAKVAEIANVSQEQLQVLHNPEKGGPTRFEYRLSWVRSYLKKYGILENSTRGVWVLTPKGKQLDKVDPKEIIRFVREQSGKKQETHTDEALEEESKENQWREELRDILLKMDPSAFERLTMHLLREAGFIQVEVKGGKGDGGVDGNGIMQIHGFLSFRVIFQCKRYQDSVRASQIRDFQGAMHGRAERGLFVTTGSFTPDAIKEANRDDAPPIDLINGEQLIDKLKEFGLGVKTEEVKTEKVTISRDWFAQI